MTQAVAVLGATGLVGQRLVHHLEDHPWFETVAVTASPDRVGERYGDSVTWRLPGGPPAVVADLAIGPTEPDGLTGEVDIVLSALPGSVAAEIEPAFAETGRLVCSNASPGRMDPDVPLLIPEINLDHLSLIDHQREHRGWSGALIKNPNCTTTTITLPLGALRAFGLESASVVTMQAISGGGAHGVAGVDIVDNVLPDIPGEADKVASEPTKLLGTVRTGEWVGHPITIDAACHRVPVVDGHLATCFVDVDEEPTHDAVVDALTSFEGVELPSSPARPISVIEQGRRPQPRLDRHRSAGMGVSVGPVRVDGGRIAFTCLAHNTIRGAAGACLLAAEAAVDNGYV